MLNIESNTPPKPFALFNLGFRPFFLGAGAFATIALLIWMGIYTFGWRLQPFGSAQTWHGHEMIYGYALAVIAGFLLTAVKNWTGLQTASGLPLSLLFLLWLAGRLLPFVTAEIQLVAVVDNLFILMLMLSIALPVVRKRQWQHLTILLILLLLLVFNLVFYAGLLGYLPQGVTWGLYSGVYLVMALIFLMGRRVIPFFIEKGVDQDVQLTNYQWLDVTAPILFVLFWVSDLFLAFDTITAILAGLLFMLHGLRLIGWYTPGIWHKPLLWVLWLAYASLTAGFLLKALVPLFGISTFIALHAFAYGGIGVMTLGMMARVALGHTGRNVFDPPPILTLLFAILLLGAIVRVMLPLLMPHHYTLWVTISQGLWITAFAMFFILYLPILYKPRIDGRFG
jgi:uncharacterized protein involved in response to NO